MNKTRVCTDRQHAIEFLQAELQKHGCPPPFNVTLDLNMPRMGDIEFLDRLRSGPALSHAFVFGFSKSDTPADINSAFADNVAGYIVKKNPSESFAAAPNMLDAYVRVVELPV